ncbi:MAG: hypothetical protein ABJA69_11060 [Acidobacteriaceae bacterium]
MSSPIPHSPTQDRAKDTFATVEKIANAVLYEGYILYPYRASAIKNQQRWNFGTLYPDGFAEIQKPVEQSRMVTECLVNGGPEVTFDVRVRFLQLSRRFGPPVAGQPSQWEEGFEKSIDFSALPLRDFIGQPKTFPITFEESETPDQQDSHSCFCHKHLAGNLVVQAETIQPHLYKVHFELENKTEIEDVTIRSRNDALLQAFVSAHLLLASERGRFISLLEPPDAFRQAASGCSNVGSFPVLVSEDGQKGNDSDAAKIMLSSPIILYDYPTVAPESAGDFFDATEMDEMLSLRVMTMTDEEKQEMRGGDRRARAILERTESLPNEHLMKVHGAVRGMRKVQQ